MWIQVTLVRKLWDAGDSTDWNQCLAWYGVERDEFTWQIVQCRRMTVKISGYAYDGLFELNDRHTRMCRFLEIFLSATRDVSRIWHSLAKRGGVLVEFVLCSCTVRHITARYSRHDSDISLWTQTSLAQFGSKREQFSSLCTAHFAPVLCWLPHLQISIFETARRRLIEDQDTILELSGAVQESQNERNWTCVSKEFQDLESNFWRNAEPFFWNAESQRRAPMHLGHTCYIGKRFADPHASSSALYPHELHQWNSSEEPLHLSTVEKSERPDQNQDLRC